MGHLRNPRLMRWEEEISNVTPRIPRTLMNPGVQQIVGWCFVGFGAVLSVYGGILVKDAREALRSQKESVRTVDGSSAKPENLKELQVRIAVLRLMDDFEGYLKKIVEAHSKDIDQIAQEMNYRGLYSSGPHIGAQFNLANKHREEISGRWLDFTRKIQDVLLADGKRELPDSELRTRYTQIQQEAENTLVKIANLTIEHFRSRSATFAPQQIDAAEKELLKPVSITSGDVVLNSSPDKTSP